MDKATSPVSPYALFGELLTAMETIGALGPEASFEDFEAALMHGDIDVAKLDSEEGAH